MGFRGTDVARESAALVLTDDDIASIAEGVRQGRGIFDNLRKAMAYIIAVHVSIFGMVLLPLFVSDWPLVLLPIQLALLELVIDPACSVVFEAEEHDPQLMDRPPRQIGAPIFGRLTLAVAALQGAGLLIAVAAVYLWSIAAGDTDTRTRSLTFTALVFGNLLLIIVNRSWRLSAVRTFVERRNPMLKWIVGITLIVTFLMLYVPALRHAFGFGPVGWGELAAVAAVSMLGVAWFEVLKACGRRGWVSLTSA
jgi:Ca2+-transporting ATPase